MINLHDLKIAYEILNINYIKDKEKKINIIFKYFNEVDFYNVENKELLVLLKEYVCLKAIESFKEDMSTVLDNSTSLYISINSCKKKIFNLILNERDVYKYANMSI